MNWLRQGWRAIGNRLSHPLDDAVKQAKHGWDRFTARDREAPPGRVFSLHVIRAAISWVTRLGLDRSANRKISRRKRKLIKLAALWPGRANALSKQYESTKQSREKVEGHRAEHGSAIARSVIVLVVGLTASVLLTMVDLPFVEGAVEMLIDDPAQSIAGIKIVTLAGVGFGVAIAGLAKMSATAVRGIAWGPRQRSDIPLLLWCLLLVIGFVVAVSGPRQEAVQFGNGSSMSELRTPSADTKATGKEHSQSDGDGFPWLLILLGVSPYLVTTTLLAGGQTRPGEEELKLLRLYAWSRWRIWRDERRFGRLQVRVDRMERRIADAVLNLNRLIGEEEAARLVHAEGYRLSGDWNGWLSPTPALVEAIVRDATPGRLPRFEPDDLSRYAAAAGDLVDGGPVRQRLERQFGNPLADQARVIAREADPAATEIEDQSADHPNGGGDTSRVSSEVRP